jgi:hypothetical protein
VVAETLQERSLRDLRAVDDVIEETLEKQAELFRRCSLIHAARLVPVVRASPGLSGGPFGHRLAVPREAEGRQTHAGEDDDSADELERLRPVTEKDDRHREREDRD